MQYKLTQNYEIWGEKAQVWHYLRPQQIYISEIYIYMFSQIWTKIIKENFGILA